LHGVLPDFSLSAPSHAAGAPSSAGRDRFAAPRLSSGSIGLEKSENSHRGLMIWIDGHKVSIIKR
jgi:hypothetical protein